MFLECFPTRLNNLSIFKKYVTADEHSFLAKSFENNGKSIGVSIKPKKTHGFYSDLFRVFTWLKVRNWGFDAQGKDEASIEVDWNFRPIYKKGCDFVIVGIPFGMNRETNFYFADMVPNQKSNCKQRYYKPDYCDPIKSLDGWRFYCWGLSHKSILPKHEKGTER